MTQADAPSYFWLKDQSRLQEVVEWLGGEWDYYVLEAWSRDRFKLDELKDWIDGKYTLDEVFKWRYLEADSTVDLVTDGLGQFYPGIKKDGGTLAFLGIDRSGNVHIAFDGACGSCTIRETTTMKTIKETLLGAIDGLNDVINDGPVREAVADFSKEEFNGASIVKIRRLGERPSADVGPFARDRELGRDLVRDTPRIALESLRPPPT